MKLPYIWRGQENDHSELLDLFRNDFPQIIQTLNRNGAILFRNFGLRNLSAFKEVLDVFPGKELSYLGGNSPRSQVSSNIFTSTEHASNAFISLHNEMSYSQVWPSHLFFWCQIEPIEGGATPLVDSRQLLCEIPDYISDKFINNGIIYVRNLHNGDGIGPSWMSTFQTDKAKEVEGFCKNNDISIEWSSNGLHLEESRASIATHPITREQVWFNQADQFHPSTNSEKVYRALQNLYKDPLQMPQNAFFGDMEEIPLEYLTEIREITKKNMQVFDWEKEDLLLIDNVLAAHGRMPFKGSRKILASLQNIW